MNLEACYDQQLAQIGSIVQESMGVERNIIKLIAKVIPDFQHYIYTTYRVSEKYYRGQNNQLGGTG